MPQPIIFGEIPGIEEGYHFNNRREMVPSSFHRMWAAGIDGNKKDGAAAIVLSGGYEDDFDLGDEIIYTGAGGNDTNTGRQIEDQSWENRGNAGLRTSMDKGLPVRVVRGYMHKSDFSPKIGYTYAGIYSVTDSWEEIGKSGFKICRFKLIYNGLNPIKQNVHSIDIGKIENEKRWISSTVLRIVRDTKMARNIKEMYNYECQVCGDAIPTLSGRYAEGAHIKPLGRPHDGKDSSDNLICLCPNHHIMFDRGAFSISNDLKFIGALDGQMILRKDHIIDVTNLEYHRHTHGYY